jgi:hypothetical protein
MRRLAVMMTMAAELIPASRHRDGERGRLYVKVDTWGWPDPCKTLTTTRSGRMIYD